MSETAPCFGNNGAKHEESSMLRPPASHGEELGEWRSFFEKWDMHCKIFVLSKAQRHHGGPRPHLWFP